MTDEEVNEESSAVKAKMTVAEYAEYKGVSPASIYKRIRENVFSRDGDGLIDVAEADRLYYSKSSRVRMTGTRADEAERIAVGSQSVLNDKEELIRQRARRETLTAEKEEINVARLKGTVVDKQAVETLVFTIAKQNSEGWLNWANEIAVEVASELDCDPSLFHSVIKREVRRHLREHRLDIDIESVMQD